MFFFVKPGTFAKWDFQGIFLGWDHHPVRWPKGTKHYRDPEAPNDLLEASRKVGNMLR